MARRWQRGRDIGRSGSRIGRIRRSASVRFSRLVDRRVIDRTASESDPVTIHRATRFGSPLVMMSLDRVRQYSAPTPLIDTDLNPFSALARELIENDGLVPDHSSLHDHFERWRPVDAAHVYLGRPSTNGLLDGLPPTPDCLPWGTFDSVEGIRASVRAHENRQIERFGPSEPARHGFRSFGPSSEVAIDAYVEEYRSLVDSIIEHGYRPGLDDHPSAQLLIGEDGNWCARLIGGNHRLAVLAAQGVTETPIVLRRRIIHHREVGSWAGVRLGLYTTDEALEVLHRFIDGEPVPGSV